MGVEIWGRLKMVQKPERFLQKRDRGNREPQGKRNHWKKSLPGKRRKLLKKKNLG